MPYRRQQFVDKEIYHIISRGIDDNLIFRDTNDYYRCIFSIYEFNDNNPVEILERRKQRRKEKITGDPISRDRDCLVEILAFCFMPNHIHLLLRQVKENGIIKFMRKVGIGYGGYFNRKYNRKGYVFQGRFLAVRVKDDNQLRVVFNYIHSNPISLIRPKWKEIGINEPEEVIKFLENYKWSSYSDYLGKQNFSSVTEREFLLEIMEGAQGCQDFIENWVKYKENIKNSPGLFLEE